MCATRAEQGRERSYNVKKTVVLHSSLTRGAAAEALRRSIDQESLTLFSLSGFQGSCPVLGEVDTDSFRLRKRLYYRNDFARQFYGRFEEEPGGTRIEGYFAYRRFPRIFITAWFVGVVSLGTIAFISTVRDQVAGSHRMGNNTWIGLVALPALVLFGIVLLWFSRMLSSSGERFLLEHLKATLSARIEEHHSTVS